MSRFLSPFVCHSSPPQAFPPVPEERKPNSRLQERLLKKLGQHAHPFYFTVSPTEKTSISEVKDHVVCREMFCYKNARSCCYGLLVVMWCKQQVIATKPCVGLLSDRRMCLCCPQVTDVVFLCADSSEPPMFSHFTARPGGHREGKTHTHTHTPQSGSLRVHC